jgi:hypothetical protein
VTVRFTFESAFACRQSLWLLRALAAIGHEARLNAWSRSFMFETGWRMF